MSKKDYKIDAEGKTIGRVASEAAKVLMGKDSPEYKPNVVVSVAVQIVNASKSNISEKKKVGKTYSRYSGYPGGQKVRNLEDLISKKGISEVYKKAVYGMLPGNRLRSERMKNLSISE